MARLLVYPALVAVALWQALIWAKHAGALPAWASWTIVHGAPAAAYLAWALVVSAVCAVRRWRPRYSLRSLMLFVLFASCCEALYINWEPWRCERVLEHRGTYKGVPSACFCPDGKRIVTASEDGTARIWRRTRPEWWWGVFCMLEFWFAAGFAAGLVWSLLADKRTFARMDAEAAGGKVES